MLSPIKKVFNRSAMSLGREISHTQFAVKGKWCRLDYFRHGITQIALTGPAGSFIRIRYGWKWFSAFSQLQQLDGIRCKKLLVIRSLHYLASAEIYATRECFVSYTMI